MENSGKQNVPELFNNLTFEFNNEKFTVDNENDLLNYINKINICGNNFEKKYKFKYLKPENIYEKQLKKFISLFQNRSNIHESMNGNIKNTNTSTKSRSNTNNNVFILNGVLELDQEFCYEIKLGNGFWDNLSDMENNINLKLGLLELNREKIKKINEYITITQDKKLEFQSSIDSFEGNNLFSNNKEIGINNKFEQYKNSIYYCVNVNNIKVPISQNLENKNENNRLIQKNDIIGVVYNNETFKDFIEMKIYINGNLASCELISRSKAKEDEDQSDLDDEFKVEKQQINSEKNKVLVPFIELGDNKTIFIKDKESMKKELWNKIKSNERIEYINIYKVPPLNYFPEEMFELQNITNAYFDLLIKIGGKIFKHKKNEINKYFQQLINFFKIFTFNNRIVAENCLLDFLSHGIDIDNGKIDLFKENVETLLKIINEIEINNNSNKIKLLEKIICFLIEIIMENNSNFLDFYKLEKYQNGEMENLKIYKFILCFLLFDNFFMQGGDEIVFSLLSKVSLFNYEKNIFNFCSSLFNSYLYYDSVNARDYIKKFFVNNIFDKSRFLDTNFRKYIGDKFYNKIFEDNQYMMQIIIKEIDINKKEKTKQILKFISGFCRSDDNFSIINMIIIQLIKNYFIKSNAIDELKVRKIIHTNYISFFSFKSNDNEYTFYGKKEGNNKRDSLINININDEEKKEAVIFELIVKCISNYYEFFAIKEKSANDVLELLAKPEVKYTDLELYKINNMIEFYQSIFFGNFYLHLGYFTNYLLKFLNFCIKEKYLDIIPYYPYLQNILFILDMIKIRCSFIAKDNLIENSEISIVYSNIDKILKYVTSFLGTIAPSLIGTNNFSIDEFEKIINLHIKILIKVMNFDKNIIKDSIPSIKDNLSKTFKNLSDLYIKEKYKKIYNNINILIEFLYGFECESNKKEHISISSRNILFKDLITKEMEEFKLKLNEEHLTKNNYIEHTLYYNIFLILYKRIKIIRNSIFEIFDNNFLFENNTFYQRQYLNKFTNVLKTFYNFLNDHSLIMLYDINNICFLKINSFICKTFKVLHEEGLLKKLQNIFLEDLKTCEDFLTTFFYLVSLLLISKDKKGEEYYSQMARSRKGFYFDLFKINFEKYFGYPQCKIMIEFMDILQIQFRKSCDDKDVLKLEEVNDNSIDLENREQCAICLEYTEEKDVHLNPCNHCFHMKCVKDMVSNNTKKCPLCKRVILGVKEDPSFVISSINERRSFSLFSNSEYDGHAAHNLFLFRDNSSSQSSNNQSPSIFGNAHLFQDNERNNQNNINNISIFNNNNNGGLFGNSNNNNFSRNLFSGNSLFG